jgi:tRNA nucleotidyltransferase (CCA-adding enzyme)
MVLRIDDDRLVRAVRDICALARDDGGRALVVGGAVRDALLDLAVQDVDIEVYGIAPGRLKQMLGGRYRLDLVGEAFGVLKLHGLAVDVSIPRRESKRGLGHKGFEVLSDPTLSFREAASRRDFTINAMGYDPLTEAVLDAYGGRADLEARILRHTSEKFVEDPLRVLRGMQFAARFDLTPAPETVALCATIAMDEEGLARERIFEEWRKLIVAGRTPSRGLAFLEACGWLRFFPELEALVGCPQEPEWHPEGDVWTHTLHCMDAFAREATGDGREDLVVGLAVLCHDLGKPLTIEVIDGRIRTYGHEQAGVAPTREFLSAMTAESDLIDEVVDLVVDHLKPTQLYDDGAGDAAVRRLAAKVKRIDRLVRVARADHLGRPPRPDDGFPAGDWLIERAHQLGVRDSAPRPIVMGRHLIALGLPPGPTFGVILRQCYDAQVQGTITDEVQGIAFVRALQERGH